MRHSLDFAFNKVVFKIFGALYEDTFIPCHFSGWFLLSHGIPGTLSVAFLSAMLYPTFPPFQLAYQFDSINVCLSGHVFTSLNLNCIKLFSRWTQNDIDGKGKLDSK